MAASSQIPMNASAKPHRQHRWTATSIMPLTGSDRPAARTPDPPVISNLGRSGAGTTQPPRSVRVAFDSCDFYQRREHTFAQVMAGRQEWEQATAQSRQLAIAADAELRRHPDRKIEPLRSAGPATLNASTWT